MTPEENKKRWRVTCAFTLPVFLAAMVVLGLMLAGPWAWCVTALLMSFYIGMLGKAITLRWWGVFIDERNKVSLSRFQMAVWTVVVVSGFLVMALMRIRAGTDQLIAPIPNELLILLGIGTGSLVAAPVVKNEQGAKRETLHRNVAPDEARFADMFKNEHEGEEELLDLSKLQMFFFTLVAVLVYCAMLWRMFAGNSGYFLEFPGLTEKLLWLLGISHAGYLTGKAASLRPPVAP